jgi:electron transfer flavoprotein beta subunit
MSSREGREGVYATLSSDSAKNQNLHHNYLRRSSLGALHGSLAGAPPGCHRINTVGTGARKSGRVRWRQQKCSNCKRLRDKPIRAGHCRSLKALRVQPGIHTASTFRLSKSPRGHDYLRHMSTAYQVVVCGTIVPDPLQTLEPVTGPAGPALKNELMLPAVLDPWASHALYEAANLARKTPGSKVWLVSLGPKAKLQQVMMTVAQKVPFELIALDGPASGFTEAAEVAAALAEAIQGIPGLDRSKLLLCGGWESASRGAGATMQMVGERLGILDQFQGVDELKVNADGSLEILERIEGGKHQVSRCAGPPALLGWATGNLPEPKNNPQVGMVNMRTVMPALQKAKPTKLAAEGLTFDSVSLPKQLRETRIVKDKSPDEIAREIVEWIKK